MTNDNPDPDVDHDAEYAAYIADTITRRSQRLAELGDRLNIISVALDDIRTLDEDISDSNDVLDGLDDAALGDAAWLNWQDREVFREHMAEMTRTLRTLTAINRPHPGTALYPTHSCAKAFTRHQYAVHATLSDGSTVIVGDHDPLRTALRASDFRAWRLLNDKVATAATVKVRHWEPGDWTEPNRSDDD